MKQPNFWRYSSFLGLTLIPFSLVYRFIYTIKYIVTQPYTANKPVICIGNVTVGGAGKTPTALAICKILTNMGYKTTFLSRGYGGTLKGPVKVDSTIHNASDVGDEPLLLSKISTTIISKNRKQGIKFACQSDADIIIMDDGLQNPTIFKNLSLLVIDGSYGIGNGHPMPAGPLRETLKQATDKSSAVIFIGDDKTSLIRRLKNIQIIKAKVNPIENKIPKDKNFLAFAGLANPGKFFTTLKESGFNVVEEVIFPDHYNYTKNDIEKLFKKAKKLKVELITTEKDFIRLSNKQQKKIHMLPIEIVWEDVSIIENILKNDLKNPSPT